MIRAAKAVGGILLCSAALLSFGAAAQEWPARAVTWIVPVPPGGALDITARLLQQPVSAQLGQPVVVENRPGGSHLVGTLASVQAAPDGYTFGTVSSSFVTNSWLVADVGYDPRTDVEPVTCFWTAPSVISVHPDQPFEDLRQLLDHAEQNPGDLIYGTPATGSSMHIAGEYLGLLSGAELTHVAYNGAGPALVDAVAGHIPMAITNVQSTAPLVREGALRALAVTSAERSELLPDVPTVAEFGFDGYNLTEWYCLVAPRGTDTRIIEKMGEVVRDVIASPEIAARYAEFGFAYEALGSEETAAFFERAHELIGKIIEDSGIRFE